MPGLVDVHCHINQPAEDMRRYWIAQLRWGVTTMRSAGNDKPETVPLFRETRNGAFLAPRSYTAGQGFNVNGPYPGAPTFKPASPDEARANVRSLKAQNVDFVKIWMTNPKFPPDVIAAIVDEGGRRAFPSSRTSPMSQACGSSPNWASPTSCTIQPISPSPLSSWRTRSRRS